MTPPAPSSSFIASIVGGSGFTGGELLRLLLGHPNITVAHVTSRQNAGRFVSSTHPNLRGRTDLRFTTPDQVEPCDVLFLCLPHKATADQIEQWAEKGSRIIDLSADFRLRDAAAYERWYGQSHSNPAWLDRFTYGLPETNRATIATANYVSGVGCNATSMNLALLPLARAGLIERVVADIKVGSSEGGTDFSLATHHPIRSGAMRTFAPTSHRHQAEVIQELGEFELHVTATAVEMIRGVLCTAHVFLNDNPTEKDLWKLYRGAYRDEPFVRLVNDRTGLYRLPEPKILAGSNYCDVGFKKDDDSTRVVAISAIDNLMKGAAGSAVQSMNIMLGLNETAGLTFPGLHPI